MDYFTKLTLTLILMTVYPLTFYGLERDENKGLTLERGGIDNFGHLADNTTRLRTNLLPSVGCVRLNPGFSIINAIRYDDNGESCGLVDLKYSNGYYYWDISGGIRISFFSSLNPNLELDLSDKPIGEYCIKDRKSVLSKVQPLDNLKVLNPPTRTVIEVSDYNKGSALRIPILVAFDNGDLFLSYEEHTQDGCISYFMATSQKGSSFESRSQEIPMQGYILDRRHDVLFGISHNKIYKSKNHGVDWIFVSNINVIVPIGYESIIPSPTCGIQLSNGILVTTIRAIKWKNNLQYGKIIDKESAFVLYSADFGRTWHQSVATPNDIICDETLLVEYPRNRILLNARGGTEYYWNCTHFGRRVLSSNIKDANLRKRWTVSTWCIDNSDGAIWDPLCNASLLKIKNRQKEIYVFCNPFMPGEFVPRRNLLLQASEDCERWEKIGFVSPFSEIIYGYCSLSSYGNHLFLAYDAKDGIRLADITDIILNTMADNRIL